MNTQNSKIIIDNRSRYKLDLYGLSRIWDLLSEQESLTQDNYVNLLLTDDETILNLNKKYLGRDNYTDIIAFSAGDQNIPLLGDMIIDVRIADEQKGERELERELEILFLHGMLHLLGYDHLAEADKKIMYEKEKYYLNILDK